MNPVERKNAYLKKLESKEWDMAAFNYNCALWSLEPECLAAYEVRQYPVLPKEMLEYYDLPLEKRVKIPREFFDQVVIKDYISMRSRVFAYNSSDYDWLLRCKDYIPDTQENLEYHMKIDSKLNEFRRWFSNENPQLKQLTDIFGGTEL